eukprot:gene23217-30438_t
MIDEGDPPKQLEKQQQLLDLVSADACQQAKVVTVKACGNQVLGAIIRFIPQLPPYVRFIFTSRPDAVCGGIRSILKRAFSSSVTFIDSPEELREEAVKPATSTPPTPRTTGSRVMLYDTVARECNLLHSIPPSSSTTDLSALRALYELVFDSSKAGTGEGVPPYLPLLHVIMAAQEPLSHAMLHEMGMACLLKDLPGWGCLFYEADHHIYSYHKSMSDWLLLGKEANPRHSMQDSVSKGHATLGAHLISPFLTSQPSEKPQPASQLLLSRYTSQYVFLHLSKAKSQPCSLLLDAALARWDLLKALFRAGQGDRVVSALGGMDVRTPYAEDSLRWLRRFYHAFDGEPESMERATYADCPIKSSKFAEALSRLPVVPTVTQLGGMDGILPDH